MMPKAATQSRGLILKYGFWIPMLLCGALVGTGVAYAQEGNSEAAFVSEEDRRLELEREKDRSIKMGAPVLGSLLPLGAEAADDPVLVSRSLLSGNLWTDGIVPFVWDPSVICDTPPCGCPIGSIAQPNCNDATTCRNQAIDAMQAWEAVSALQFVPFDEAVHDRRMRFVDGSCDLENVVSFCGASEVGDTSQDGFTSGAFCGGIGGPCEQTLTMVCWGTAREAAASSSTRARMALTHELGHAVGLTHEQARPDRDTYVTLQGLDLSTPEVAVNFGCVGGAPCVSLGPYDYDSNLQYRDDALTTCLDDGDRWDINGNGTCDTASEDNDGNGLCNLADCRTILVNEPFNSQDIPHVGREFGPAHFDSTTSPPGPLANRRLCFTDPLSVPDGRWQNQIGQQDHMSYYDCLNMSFLYPEPNWRFLSSTRGAPCGSFSCPDGRFLEPWQNWDADFNNSLSGTGTTKVWLEGGAYSVPASLSKPATLESYYGPVTLIKSP